MGIEEPKSQTGGAEALADPGVDQQSVDVPPASLEGFGTHGHPDGTGLGETTSSDLQLANVVGPQPQIRVDQPSMAELEDQTLELVRMRSLVEHLTERLERVEESRSFDSASSVRHGSVHQVMPGSPGIRRSPDLRTSGDFSVSQSSCEIRARLVRYHTCLMSPRLPSQLETLAPTNRI